MAKKKKKKLLHLVYFNFVLFIKKSFLLGRKYKKELLHLVGGPNYQKLDCQVRLSIPNKERRRFIHRYSLQHNKFS